MVSGDTGKYLHVLHRQKAGRDVFLVCNQNHEGTARTFKFKVTAAGEPECWDPMRNEITVPTFRRRDACCVEIDLTLEPSESVLLVFQDQARQLPKRISSGMKALREIPLVKTLQAEFTADDKHITLKGTDTEAVIPSADPSAVQQDMLRKAAGRHFNASPVTANPMITSCTIPADLDLSKSRVFLAADDLTPEAAASASVNGQFAGGFIGQPLRLDITRLLKPGDNTIRLDPFAPKSARLVVY